MRQQSGFALALGSSATFGLSGMFAAALFDAGWSPGAVTTVRMLGATALLAIPLVIIMRGRWMSAWRARWNLMLFGVFAVTVAQLGYFSAVQFIPPALALVIEFLGPVLLVLWNWARSRHAPAALTIIGIVIAVLGLALTAGVGAGALHPVGVMFALGSAVGNAVYWATAASAQHDVPPVALAGFGLGIGGILLAIVSALGILPFHWTLGSGELAGVEFTMPILIGGLVVFATVTPYILGIAGARRLGPTVASFVGYSEPLFGVLWMALLLSLLPSANQWIGAGAIVAGVVLVKIGQMRADRTITGATSLPAV